MHRIVLLLLAGCGLIHIAPTGGESSVATTGGGHQISEGRRTYHVGPYWGPDCERIGAPKDEINRYAAEKPTVGKQPNIGHDVQDQVLRLVCVDRILASESEPGANTWVMQYERFDELAFDHWTAAMMLVQCLEAESCLDDAKPAAPRIDNPDMQKRMAASAGAHEIAHTYEIAMMRWFAERVDPATVAAKLATLPLPPAAQKTYLALLAKAKERVLAVSGQLPPDVKHLFVDIPEEVHAARAQMFAKHAKVVAELAALGAQVSTERAAGKAGVSDATIDQLRQLRAAYYASCKACTHDAIFTGISRELFWSYVSRADGAAAMAEAKLLDHPDPNAAVEIAKQQRDAINHAIGRTSRVARAREQGIDADSSHGSTTDLGDGHYIYDVDPHNGIDWASLVPDGGEIGQFDGKIASLERSGSTVLVRFADRVSSYSESTGCYETNRIDGIGDDGKLIYRQACSGSETHVEHAKVAPIKIPASEAVNLAGGDELVGFAHAGAEPRLGRVWLVKRGGRIARLREVVL
jgi:hypothetical protein